MISKVISSDKSDEEVRRVDRSFHRVSSPLFFFHLLKLKKKIQKIENVPTTPPTADCICVPYYLCDANRTIIADGIGVIDIRPTSVIQYPVVTNPPVVVSPQICVLCGNAIQCNNGVVIPVNVGVINPVVTYSQQTCPVPTSCCQAINTGYGNGIPVVIGPVRNPGTSQACYCMKSWLCVPGNSVSINGVGAIDPRFSVCGSADEVCCRASPTINIARNDDLDKLDENVVNGEVSFLQPGCGIQNKTYATAQPYPVDTGKTYFAEFPWMVALLTVQSDEKYEEKKTVSLGNNRPIARFGQWDLKYQLGDQPLPFLDASIKAIVAHPQFYNAALFNDIAVIILNEPVKLNVNIAPICIPQQGLLFPPGTKCIGTGWGKNSFGGTYQTELRKVELPLVDRSDCQNRLRTTRLGAYFQLHSSFICAGGEVNKDTCRGDGGGPLVCPTATGQYFQAGIVSWGIGCGSSNVPAVYTNVAKYTEWISQQLATYGAY
ncbi:Serine proteinase stubble [Melipona quadrifasciata]|uniref:Serine proteinase stubble n=1 Tax=Melipona quadrifasciata TaxID=166423 RepID=A0A0M9A2R7_9HYME|nr:Serine proteinase stubble [Melipona quadrifasciata]